MYIFCACVKWKQINNYINRYVMQQGYQQQIVPTKTSTTTTTTTTTTTQKPIILVEKSVLPPLGEIPSPLMKLKEIPSEITKGMTKTKLS